MINSSESEDEQFAHDEQFAQNQYDYGEFTQSSGPSPPSPTNKLSSTSPTANRGSKRPRSPTPSNVDGNKICIDKKALSKLILKLYSKSQKDQHKNLKAAVKSLLSNLEIGY